MALAPWILLDSYRMGARVSKLGGMPHGRKASKAVQGNINCELANEVAKCTNVVLLSVSGTISQIIDSQSFSRLLRWGIIDSTYYVEYNMTA